MYNNHQPNAISPMSSVAKHSLFLVALLAIFAASTAIADHGRNHVSSVTLSNTVGAECPASGVRVEAVTPRANQARQEIIVTIPKGKVHDIANFSLYNADNSKFAFDEYKEIRDGRSNDRRTFSFVVSESEQIRFKVGFDSALNSLPK